MSLPHLPFLSSHLPLPLPRLLQCLFRTAYPFFYFLIFLSYMVFSLHSQFAFPRTKKTKRFCLIGWDTFRAMVKNEKRKKWSGSHRCLTYDTGIVVPHSKMGLRSPTNWAGTEQPLKWIPPTTCFALSITPIGVTNTFFCSSHTEYMLFFLWCMSRCGVLTVYCIIQSILAAMQLSLKVKW